MQNRQTLLDQLAKLIIRKQSKRFYAKTLNISVEDVDSLLSQLRSTRKEESPIGKMPSPIDLQKTLGIDNKDYKLSQFWAKQGTDSKVSISANVSANRAAKVIEERSEFLEFLKTYQPKADNYEPSEIEVSGSCLIINKQDAHLNKYDINNNNDINDRFNKIEEKIEKILAKANTTSYLKKIIYILGSDEFNSEWNNMTTKGTPQQNILSYQESFEVICNHELSIIRMLARNTDELEILYIPGNHDEYVGWHLLHWLKAFYRDVSKVSFDICPKDTKYVKYSNTGICFNHGDVMRPEKLAQNFPIEFREHWSSCENFYIFTGDKHTELSREIGGIKFFRIPALSRSVSKWDNKNGYNIGKAQMTAFLIEEDNGLTDIYHEVIK